MSAKLIKTDGSKIDISPANGELFSLDELSELAGGASILHMIFLEESRIMAISGDENDNSKEANIIATMLGRITSSISLGSLIRGDVILLDASQLKQIMD